MVTSSKTDPQGLEQLVYVSVDTRNVTNPIRAADILAEARRNNARDQITGALTFTNGQFVQILEGRTPQLENLMERLRADRRHRDVQIIARRDISHRDFHGWDMVSPRLAKPQIERLNDLMGQPVVDPDAYVDLLAEAVHRQAGALAEYGFDPKPDPSDAEQSQSPTA